MEGGKNTKDDNNKIAKFWKTPDGKFITSYGLVLVVIGALGVALLGIGFLIVSFSRPLAEVFNWDYLLILVPPILLHLLYIIFGICIKKCLYTPNKLQIINIVVLILSALSILYNIFYSSSYVILIDAIALIGAALYQFNWHKAYVEAYSKCKK